MTLAVLQHRALDLAAGSLLANVDIRVRRESAGLPLVSIYEDKDGVTPLANPTTGGHFSDGKIRCYIVGGFYRVELLVDGQVVDTFFDVGVGLGQGSDQGDGASAGFIQAFDSATADADPSAGEFRLNHATPTSATAIYIDNLSASSVDISGIVDKWDDSTNTIKGTLKIEKVGNPAIYYEWNVTGTVVDGTGYRKVTIASGAGAGTLTAADQFVLTFSRAGDAGVASATDVVSTGNVNVQIDSDNNTTNAEFQIRKDSATPGGGTLLFSVNEAGLVTILGQIAFPSTQNASANANTLDDYEEGTWTPTLTFGTPGDLSVTYTEQVGLYTKIGRLVTVEVNLRTATFTHTTASGNMAINGLPFTSANLGQSSRGNLLWSGVTKANYTDATLSVAANLSSMSLALCAQAQTAVAVAAADMPTGGTVRVVGTVSYPAA